jgi:hypothetical protein
MRVLRQFLVTLLALAAAAVQAGPFAPKQNPDNFSGWGNHLAAGGVPGLFVGTAWPQMHWAKQGSLCMVPGLIHEFAPSHGNTWSARDILVDGVGCGLGLWASTGFRIATAPRNRVMVLYSITLP